MPTPADVELAIIGACLINQDSLLQAAETLRPDMFTGRNRAIFAAIQAAESADLVLISEEFQKQNKNQSCAAYLAEIANSTVITRLLPQHLDILRKNYSRRKLVAAGKEIITIAQSDEPPEAMVARAESLVYSIGDDTQGSRIMSICDSVSQEWKNYADAPVQGVATGYPALDNALTGLQPAELVIIAARPSMGKTDLALNIARHTAKLDTKSLIYSLEMSRSALTIRMICAESEVNSQTYRLKALAEFEQSRAYDASSILMDLPIYIDDSPGLTVAEMRTKARRMQREQGLDLIIIDYLQLVRLDDKKKNRNEAVGEAAQGLKNMAKELNIPVVLLSQLSREVEKRNSKIPQLSDLRDSGEIEQVADVVIFPHRPDYYDLAKSPGIMELYIAKQRNGPIGKVSLRYTKQYNRIEPLGAVDKAKEAFGGVEGRTGQASPGTGSKAVHQ